MKSGKQRRAELEARRTARQEKNTQPARRSTSAAPAVSVNPELLVPSNSYGMPAFVLRGFYEDVPFRCVDCGKAEVWTAAQQKWWYEVAKGNVESRATRCRPCRRRERARRDEARRVHLEGVARKRGNAHRS